VQALIFDMDGVLVDSEPIHFAVARQILAQVGIEFTDKTARAFVGQSVRDFLRAATHRWVLPGTPEEYEAQYDTLFLQAVARPLPPRDGAVWLIDEARRRGCRVGLASTSRRSWIDALLRATGLEGRFDAVVGGDMVEDVKPAPDIYLRAAAGLGLSPASCVAVEDSAAGVRAARSAGMRVVGLITPLVEPHALGEADILITSLRDFPVHLLSARTDPGGASPS
jgi:HAD superfamily hydrolase (TIGR01509 family)